VGEEELAPVEEVDPLLEQAAALLGGEIGVEDPALRHAGSLSAAQG
jgi:hypothetical protein